MRGGVLIAASRHVVRPEAQAIAVALMAAGVPVRCLDAKLRVCEIPGAKATNAFTAVADTIQTPTMQDRLKRVLMRSNIMRAAMMLGGILRDRMRLSRVLTDEAPDVIVIFDDRRVRPELLLARLATKRGTPVIVAPFAVSTIESDVFLRRKQPEYQADESPYRALKRWVARRWPGQCLQSAGGGLLFYGLFDTLVLAATGLLARNPWVLGGSDPDLVCATGTDQRQYLLDGGLAPERIILSGQASLDQLADAHADRAQLRSELVARYRLAEDKPIILCAVPQYAEHRMAAWELQRLLVDELFAVLSGSGASVLLSLHPRSKRGDYEEAANHYHLAIIDQRLADVLPAADLLVATFSSTVAWAIGLGIPAMVVDALALNYRLYRDLPGVTVVDDHARLREELIRFVCDGEFRAQLAHQATIGRARTGRLDGGASGRIAQAIIRLIAARSHTKNAVLDDEAVRSERVAQ